MDDIANNSALFVSKRQTENTQISRMVLFGISAAYNYWRSHNDEIDDTRTGKLSA